jgi:hypothetical protein
MQFFTENMSVNNASELNKQTLYFLYAKNATFLLVEMHLPMKLSNARQLTRF